jgi:hypothetical protein
VGRMGALRLLPDVLYAGANEEDWLIRYPRVEPDQDGGKAMTAPKPVCPACKQPMRDAAWPPSGFECNNTGCGLFRHGMARVFIEHLRLDPPGRKLERESDELLALVEDANDIMGQCECVSNGRDIAAWKRDAAPLLGQKEGEGAE